MVPVVKELWTQAIQPWNLPLTILLGLVILFWSLKILTGADFDSGDADIDADADGGHGETGDFSTDILRVVNGGAVPLTIVLSVLVLAWWTASILLNNYLNPGHRWPWNLGFCIASFVISVVATKLITQPLVPIMRRLKAAEDTAPVIGESGVVRSIELDSRYGQVEVRRLHGAPAILNCRLAPGSEPVPRGTLVAIVSYDAPAGVYLASPFLTESNTPNP